MNDFLTCPQCGRSYDSTTTRCLVDGSALFGPREQARLGQRIGSYSLEKVLGVGGMGVVYRARHVILEKTVALKLLSPEFAAQQGGVKRLLREARASTRIRHPNVVDVTDFGIDTDGSPYFVMEYLEGTSLQDVLARDNHLALFQSVNIVRQIAFVLAAAHEEGIVHRDLKPENIFLITRPGRRRLVRRLGRGSHCRFVVEQETSFDFVKLIDFGVAKFTADNAEASISTASGVIFGTPHYMSPEQARGLAVDGRSDVYSLGVVFYHMVTGCLPIDAETPMEVLFNHLRAPVIPPRERRPDLEIDEGTDRTIVRCLEKLPEVRFQSMMELIEALEGCFTDTVFLRDAHRMPGAVEAGIVVPAPPDRTLRGPLPLRRGQRERSITEELKDLFVVGSSRRSLERLIPPEERTPPLLSAGVRPTSLSLHVPEGDDDDEDGRTTALRLAAVRSGARSSRSPRSGPGGNGDDEGDQRDTSQGLGAVPPSPAAPTSIREALGQSHEPGAGSGEG